MAPVLSQLPGSFMKLLLSPAIRGAFFALTTALAALVHAQGAVVGVDIPGVGQMSAQDHDQLLNSLHESGVRVVRAWIGTDRSYEFIKKAYAIGIKTELTLSVVSQPDARKRPAVASMPWMFSSVPLSAADVELTKSTFQTQLNRLEELGIELVAFELGNELNSPAFNGEFTLHPKADCTDCKTMSVQDLKQDSEGQKIAAGFRNYVNLLAAVKDVRDRSRLNRRTPVLLGGMADQGAETVIPRARANRVSVKAAIEYMREFGLDKIVDGYGIHTYPWDGPPKPGAAAERRQNLENYALSECRPAGSAVGKPCWITEWGFKNGNDSCPVNDDYRASLVREFMTEDLRPYVQQGRVAGLLYFVWQRNPGAKQEEPYSIFRCGGLTESGRLAVDASPLR